MSEATKLPEPAALAASANRVLVIKLLAALVSYGFAIFLARAMLTRDFGLVAFFLNLSLILSVIGARGQQIAALRFVPTLFQTGDTAMLRAYVGFAARKAATGTALVLTIAAVIVIVAKANGRLMGYSWAQLGLGLLLVPLVGWVDLQSHIARGCRFLSLALIPKEVLWRATAAAAVLVVFAQNRFAAVGATPVLGGLLVTLAFIALAQGAMLWRKTTMAAHRSVPSVSDAKDWQASAGAFWVTSVSNIFLANADVVLIGLFAGTGAAGIYFAANRLAMLLSFFLTSYNTVLAPLLAAAWQTGDRARTKDLIRNATLKTTVPTLVLGIVLGGLAPQFLTLFGPEFVQATTPLRLLILAGVLNAASGPADIALSMCGFHQNAKWVSAVSLAISILLLGLGALTGGVTGIALAVLIATIIRKALFWWQVRRQMSLRTDILGVWTSRTAAGTTVRP